MLVAALSCACAGVQAPVAAALPFRTLDQARQSHIATPRTVVVRDAAGWARLWAEHAGPEAPPPPVDFKVEMVVGVFIGTRESGCHATEIVAVERVGDHLRVREADRVPGPAVRCTMGPTAPAHLVAVPRSDLGIAFAAENVTL